MFETFIERPVFNLLEFIYGVIPGHDFGLSIIVFTFIIRMLMWPLVKKQLHQSKAMRKLQPELKRIKKEAGKDRQKLARLQMELYKEHSIKPFTTIGTLIIQIPIFIALYQTISKIIRDPNILNTFAYDWVHNLAWIQNISENMHQFQPHLLGIVDLTRRGIESGGIYLPAILLAIVASLMQFYQSRMLLPNDKDSRKLSDILKSASSGQQADQSEISAAMSRNMIYFLPFLTFIFAINLPSALALYFFSTAAAGYLQQRRIFGEDQEEMIKISEAPTEKPDKSKPVKKKSSPKNTKTKKSKKNSAKKRRKK